MNEKLMKMLKKACIDEWIALQHYTTASVLLRGSKSTLSEKEFLEHADDEYKHIKDLLSIFAKFNVIPYVDITKWNILANCKYPRPTTRDWKVLVNDALEAEKCAITVYNEIAEVTYELKMFTIHNTVVGILSDEEEHRKDLEQLLEL